MVAISDGDKAEAQAKQRTANKRATFDLLKRKELPTREFDIELTPGEPLSMLFKAIDHVEYDKLVAKYPPNKEDEAKGASYDFNRFAPALVAAVSLEPKLSNEETLELWTGGKYNRGDLMALFTNAVSVCNVGFDVPFNKRD